MAAPEPFVIRPTPNPDEFSFITTVRALFNVPLPKKGVTIYHAWGASIPERAAEDWGGYVYGDSVESPVGWLSFLWVKKKTELEKSTPFRTYERFGNHRWPPVLRGLKFFQDTNFPNAINGPGGRIIFAPRYYVREIFIPEQNEGTRFVTEEFLSDSKYDIPQYPIPEATSVSYDILGVSGRFPECLHQRIVIPSTRTATAAYSVGEGNTGAAGALAGQIFPATNFEERAPYYVSDQQQFRDGQWYRERTQVFPPPELEPIIR
jgi:hypothetical protein